MKINVTYEASDIERLIRQDLVARGIPASNATIKYVKNKALIEIDGVEDEVPAPVMTALPVEAPPALTAIDGGQSPVDMSDVLGASKSITQQKTPLYPTRERVRLEGETDEFPGVPHR